MARGMRVLTLFVPVTEFVEFMDAAKANNMKLYLWARTALVAAARGTRPAVSPQQTVQDPQDRLPTLEQTAALVEEPRRRSAVLDDLVSDVGITREQAGALVEAAIQAGLLVAKDRDGRAWLTPAQTEGSNDV